MLKKHPFKWTIALYVASFFALFILLGNEAQAQKVQRQNSMISANKLLMEKSRNQQRFILTVKGK